MIGAIGNPIPVVLRRSGVKFVWAPPEGETITAMIEHSGAIYIATQSAVYTYYPRGLRTWWRRIKGWFKS